MENKLKKLLGTAISFRGILFGIGIFLSFPLVAQKTWYVAADGKNNRTSGSLSLPFATIDYASDAAQPGDTILVRGGVYRNGDFGDGDIWQGSNAVKISAQGASGKYIVIKPYLDEQPIIEFDDTYGILFSDGAYIKMSGIEVKGINSRITRQEAEQAWGLYKTSDGIIHDLAVEMGIHPADPDIRDQSLDKPATPNITKPGYYNGRGIVVNSSHHIEITGNKVWDVPSSAIRVQQSDYVLVSGNEVFNNTYWTTQGVGAITVAEAVDFDNKGDIKILLEKNKVHHNENRLISWAPEKSFVKFVIDEGTGLFLTRNVATYRYGQIGIFNNISYFNGASGIVCHFTDRAVIEHNTVYYNGTTNDGKAGGISLNNADQVKVINNIAYARPGKYSLAWLSPPGEQIEVSNNLLYNENPSQELHNNIPEGWMAGDPQFKDAENFDFQLSSGSPAIDAGKEMTESTEDFLNTPRTDGKPDIGAFEYAVLSNHDVPGITPDLEAYPNPFTTQIFINGLDPIENTILLDALGRSTPFTMTQTSGLWQLSGTGLSAGAYILVNGSNRLMIIKLAN